MFKIGDRINAVTECSWNSEWQNCIVNRINEYGDLYVTNTKGVEGLLKEYQAELAKETTQMFEVGKKYKGKTSGKIFECKYADEEHALLKNIRSAITFNQYEYSLFEEYVEPKVVATEWLIRTDGRGDFWTIKDENVSGRHTTVGRIRITHTEGRGIKVDILEGEDATKS